jgi:hypothetical protein
MTTKRRRRRSRRRKKRRKERRPHHPLSRSDSACYHCSLLRCHCCYTS